MDGHRAVEKGLRNALPAVPPLRAARLITFQRFAFVFEKLSSLRGVGLDTPFASSEGRVAAGKRVKQ